MSRPVLPHRGVYLAPILRLHPEVGGMFADHMDLVSLTRWRLTCKFNYDQATAALRRTLLALLRRFIPFPTTLLDMVTRSRALFGGELALAFLLRDPSYTLTTLEIYASEFEFCGLCDAILADQPLLSCVECHSYASNSHSFALRRLIAQTLTITMQNGSTVYVHRSYTISPAAPLTRNPCTALCNFVTAYSFGCSHPVLTLQRRGLLADGELRHLPQRDAGTLNNMLKHKFEMAVTPAAWPEFRFPGTVGADDVHGSEALYPRHHISAFTGFVASDQHMVDLPSPSAEHEYANDVGIAQAVLHVADLDAGGMDGHVVGGTRGLDIPPPSDHPDDETGGDRSIGTSATPGPTGSPEVFLPPSSDYVDRDIYARDAAQPYLSEQVTASGRSRDDIQRERPECLAAAREGSTAGLSSQSKNADGDPGEDPPLDGPPPTLATPRVEGAPPSLYRCLDSLVQPTPLGTPSPPALVHTQVPDPTISVGEDAAGDSMSPHSDHAEDATDVSETSSSTDARDAPCADTVPLRCWRHLYICPSQGRFFGDRGSFVDFLDPLGGGEGMCVEKNIAPYGSMVVWRIMSSFDCDEGCEYFDNVLEEGVTSIPVMFKRDPYGELRDIVSDRYMPVPRSARSPCRKRSSSV